MRDGFDVDTALGGADDHGALGGAVHEDCEVVFSTEVEFFADVDCVAGFSCCAGLFGDEFLADHLGGEEFGLGGARIIRFHSP